MWLFIAFLSVVCFALAYLLNRQYDKRSQLLEDYSELKAYQRLAEKERNRHPEFQDDMQCQQKPISIESVRTALRFNGFSPDIPDASEPGIVYFKADDINFRVIADNLPYLSLEAGYKLEEQEKDLALFHRAAEEVSQNLFIGKAIIVRDGEGVIFSAEFIDESYIHFRDNLTRYLNILYEAKKHFFLTLESLRKKREEDLKAVFSGNCFLQESHTSHKITS